MDTRGREQFGTELRGLRTRAGLSLGELAKLAHVHRGYLGHIEQGERWPSRRIVEALDSPQGHPPAPHPAEQQSHAHTPHRRQQDHERLPPEPGLEVGPWRYRWSCPMTLGVGHPATEGCCERLRYLGRVAVVSTALTCCDAVLAAT